MDQALEPTPAPPAGARPSVRLDRLPPYLFAEMERRKAELVAQGRDVIDLGTGDPDLPAPAPVRRALVEALETPGIHQYSPVLGTREYRRAVAAWMRRRWGVDLDPDREIGLAIGTKEWIAHAPLALTDPGDVVVVPEPGYPPYRSGAVFALCEVVTVRLRAQRGFVPDLSEIPSDVARRARLFFVNYPNNPTGAVAPRSFYEDLVAFARQFDILVVVDAAYAELAYDRQPASFLQVEGAREVGLEVHSLSKTFCMTGWRLGWACGNAQVVETLGSLKANLDSGQFMALQAAAARALEVMEPEAAQIREVFRRRRDLFVGALREAGWAVPLPPATLYVWFEVPQGGSSMEFAARCLEQANVLLTPGAGFGAAGEGFLRAALTVPEERLREAARRLAAIRS